MRINNNFILAVALLIVLTLPLTFAANPGHTAAGISPGTFVGGGAFTFPEQVNIQGNFIINTDTFFVDVSTGRVGIGTNTPAYDLDVAGTMRVTGNAIFGGTLTLNADPTNPLEAATKQYVDDRVGINETEASDTYVPYEGAIQSVNLNQKNLTNWEVIEGHNSSYGMATNGTATIIGFIGDI